ncbi:MAG: copper chaperone PCu(A)C [Enterobacterales bacterium]|nr:copper chaperone PCu(A)C [Enterobacterales bacterium]
MIVFCTSSSLSAKQVDLVDKLVESNESSEVLVVDAYMPEVSPVSNVAAVYLTLENHSKKSVRLSKITSPVARHIMMHKTLVSQGVSKMKHMMALDIKAGASLEFKPGGLHIMMMGLNRDKMGQSFLISLLIDGETLVVKVNVRTAKSD